MCLFLHFFLRILYAAFNINNSYETYILKYISNVQKIILIKKKKSVFLHLKMESHKVFTLGMMTPELSSKKITL